MTQKGGGNRKFADSPTQTLKVCMDFCSLHLWYVWYTVSLHEWLILMVKLCW